MTPWLLRGLVAFCTVYLVVMMIVDIRQRRWAFAGMAFSLVAMGIIILLSSAHAAVGDRWASVDPELREWFQSLKQPDNPQVSCCGSGDAYYADEITVKTGNKVFVTITDNRGNPLPVGTELEIPPHKMNRDANRTGQYIVFASPNGTVYCFISGTGI